jgi:hypothetical protein
MDALKTCFVVVVAAAVVVVVVVVVALDVLRQVTETRG